MPAAAADIDGDDPVVNEYDVFITPEIEGQLYLFQYLNRPPDQPFVKETGSRPSQLRIKPQSGFVEVDAPLDIHHHYNKIAGVKWGEAVRKTKSYGQKAYGIASGFERPNVRLNNRSGAAPDAPGGPSIDDDDNIEDYVANFEDANEKGHVLNTRTFNGQITKNDERKASYMIGTFRENQLYLTKLSGFVQLRAGFNHLDAGTTLDALARRKERESQEGVKPAEAKAFLPTVKRSATDTSAEATQKFFKATGAEQWSKLQYYDENQGESYDAYTERLFLEDPGSAQKLHASMSNAGFLDAISVPSSEKGKKRSPSKPQADLVQISDVSDEEDVGDEEAKHVPSEEEKGEPMVTDQ